MGLTAPTHPAASQAILKTKKKQQPQKATEAQPIQNPKCTSKAVPFSARWALLGPGQSWDAHISLCPESLHFSSMAGLHHKLGANLPAFPALESENLGSTSDAPSS